MWQFLTQLIETDDFTPRWMCGNWTAELGWLHVMSDSAIFAAYAAIPAVLIFFALRRRDIPFLPIFWAFAGFILFCGANHLVEATLFWHPWYRLSGLVKFATAVFSWVTVVALIQIAPRALALPGLAKVNADLENEIQKHRQTEFLLKQAQAELEKKVLERTAQLHEQHQAALGLAAKAEAARKQAEENEMVLTQVNHDLIREIAQRQQVENELKRLISERKKAEEKLHETAQELARSNADLEMFASIASHDLQEPLRMVSSYLELLAKRYQGQLDERAQRWINYAVDGATRMKNLIQDLLEFSRVNTRGKPLEPTQVTKVLETALTNLQNAIQENQAVITWGSLPTVLADKSQLTQVLQNLVGNALKFRSTQPPEIRVEVSRQNDDWLFAVRDNGIGIDPQFADRIFNIFQRLHTREEYPGTGIGLALCKKIIERHGGHIWVESQPGQGACFFFTLPGHESEPQ